MTTKKILSFIVTCLAVLAVGNHASAASSGDKPPNYNFEKYVEALSKIDSNIQMCKYFSKGNTDAYQSKQLCINQALFEGPPYNVVYGTWEDVNVNHTDPDSNYSSSQKLYRFAGLSPNGTRYQDIRFRDDLTRGAEWLTTKEFAMYPWDASKHPQLAAKLKNPIHKSYFPDPTDRITDYKTYIFGGAQDTQYPDRNDGRGNFVEGNETDKRPWILKNDSVYYGYGNNRLHQYAALGAIPSGYSGGYFTLYRMNDFCSYGYCYATFPILPEKEPFDWHDFTCYNNANIQSENKIEGEDVTSIPMSIRTFGNNTNRFFSGTLYFGFKGGTQYKKTFEARVGKTLDLNLSTGINTKTGKEERLTLPAAGDHEFYYNIVSDEQILEELWGKTSNNNCTSSVTVSSENNASVALSPSTTKFKTGDDVTGTFVVSNEFVKEYIDAPPTTESNHARYESSASDADVKANGGKSVVKIYKGSKLLETTSYTYSDIAKKGNKKISFSSKDAVYEPGTDYKAVVCIPVYRSSVTGKVESSTSDNCDTVSFQVVANGDVSVGITGEETYEAGSTITLRYSLNNAYPKKHDNVPLTVRILNQDTGTYADFGGGKTSVVVNVPNVDINAKKYGDVPSINLPLGRYKAEISIPNYPGETNYDNNKDSFDFMVLPFTPNNVDCKTIDADQINIVKGDKSVSKFCVGQTPNFPSTETEKGQGTFFFVMYRLLPTPLPSYDVTNLDADGLYQTYTLNEDPTKRGDDNSYIFYPNKKTDIPNLTGPYTAGPHEFYHFLYRGRMLPTEVTFTINVKDPTGSVIPEASGKVYYNVDDNRCFNNNQLDVGGTQTFAGIDPCRQIFFYLPKATTAQSSVNDLNSFPTKSERITFKNPGTHTFEIKAEEKQVYAYQHDNGGEWQGKEDTNGQVLREPWKGESEAQAKGAVYTNTVVNGEWVIQDDYKNHCYSDSDAFSRFGEWVNADFQVTNNGRSICFHDHSKDFHYWKFNWSKPVIYGPLSK